MFVIIICSGSSSNSTPSTAWYRKDAQKEEAFHDLPSKTEKRLSWIRRTLERFQRQCCAAHAGSTERVDDYHFELHCTETTANSINLSHNTASPMHRNKTREHVLKGDIGLWTWPSRPPFPPYKNPNRVCNETYEIKPAVIYLHTEQGLLS